MSVEDKVKKFLEKIKKEDGKINAFLHLNDKVVEEARAVDEKFKKTGKKGKLYGFVVAVKSNINVKGIICNCASRVLENYVAPYDATVISKIKGEDGVIIGMTNMDEFAAGVSGENSAFGPTQNPAALGKIPGGSSSGSAAAVAAGFCDVALGSDTGGSIRAPASHCGIVGMKPSYGAVSRYGLVDLSMSLDQIGPLAKNVEDAKLLFEVISGRDERDTMSEDIKEDEGNTINIGVLKIKGIDSRIHKIVEHKLREVAKINKWLIKEIELENIGLAVQTYYPLVYSEFYSGTRRFDGRRYGYRFEDKCGKEVLRRVLGGSEITKAEHAGAYYRRSLEIKQMISEEFSKAFGKVDCIIIPVCPILPWKVGEGDKMSIEEVYAADALTCPANLAGICSVAVPSGIVENIPVGLQVMCAKGNDLKALKIAGKFS
ncbi:MAG: Asp-tRNA(Asn)/Glu-tRNA(Gln) amidotransferase subunit GatA [Candidatus Liptonbacteria bacterium]|nr:Asp-tRNA(Asn)/Glu-tRNA(Gln) amidotransferase subunit GatA [Candidatus Pacearchaeota archaeon]MBM3257023.1 Asp-tRNA(Asn)/Glu-tRNA(Gln) amidotransferase subunit GatA [Candidatus Liptonbacteria bacterium]